MLKAGEDAQIHPKTLKVRDALKERFGDKALEIVAQRDRRVWITVPPAGLRPVMKFLRKKLGIGHCSTLTGADLGDRYEAIYFMSDFRGKGDNVTVTVKVVLPHERPKVPTITETYPGAELYERELMELFGIEIIGHPDPRHLILPEDWPEGNYPLRKEWTFEWEYSTPDDILARPKGIEPKEPEFEIKKRDSVEGGR